MGYLLLKRPWAVALGWLTAPLLFCSLVAAQKPASPVPVSAAKPPAIEKIDEKRLAELL